MIIFENFKNIKDTCKEYHITNYTINKDGSIDVDGNVDLYNKNLTKLPLNFNIVSGYFFCNVNQLTSLDGCPKEVGGHFYCESNLLTSLEGCPKKVGGYFECSHNQLTSLEGCPNEVGGGFYCHNNQLTSLEGGPEEVGDNYCCENNKIIKAEGFPKKIGGKIYCKYNPISEIYYLFPDYRSFMESLDYSYFKGSNNIDKIRFREALREFGLTLPEKLINYKYI